MKEVQKLTDHIAALNRFVAKLTERSHPFFTIVRGSTRVEWGAEQHKAFEDLKLYLKRLLLAFLMQLHKCKELSM
jgi:hypothetical protein